MNETKKLKKWRKGNAFSAESANLFSLQLREIRNQIQTGRFAEALTQLNQWMPQCQGDKEALGRLAALIGDSEARQDRVEEALHAYERARQLAGNHPRLWWRSSMGKIRVLLRHNRIEEAVNMAREALSRADQCQQEFQHLLVQTPSQLQQQGSVLIKGRPRQAAVLAAQLGLQFQQLGETEAAEHFYQESLKRGTVCRALLGLAELALRKNQWSEAESRAHQAIEQGRFQAKTIPAWKSYLIARQKQNKTELPLDLLKGLEGARPSIRARSLLLIIKTLRQCHNPAWTELAENWLTTFGGQPTHSAVSAELRKLLLATAKTHSSVEIQQQSAQRLLQTHNLSPNEWLNGAKTLLKTRLEQNQPMQLETLLEQALERFGESRLLSIRHGLALVCMHFGRFTEARALLMLNLEQPSSPKNFIRNRSLWTLARLEARQGHLTESAALYQNYADDLNCPERFRLYALIEWARALISANQPEPILAARIRFLEAVWQISDPRLVLDIARQLVQAPAALNELTGQILQRGEQLVQENLRETQNPTRALQLIFTLARRQFDFAQYDSILHFWESLNEEKRNWLWADQTEWWEYLQYIFRAYQYSNQLEKAEQLALYYMQDPATPVEAVAEFQVLRALVRLQSNEKIIEALDLFQKSLQQHAGRPLSAYAHYWLALDDWKKNQINSAHQHARQIVDCLGQNPGIGWQKELTVRGRCLLHNLQLPHEESAENFNIKDFKRQLDIIEQDLERMGE